MTVDTKLVLGTFGGIEQFKMFHRSWNPERIESGSSTTALRDEDLLAFASTLCGGIRLCNIKTLPKTERNAILKRMREAGLSIRQIERVTSIGRGIIARVECDN